MATKNTTKLTVKQAERGLYYFGAFQNSRDYSLNTVYKSYSLSKYNSFNSIVNRANEEGGSAPRVISHNCNFYSTAYIKPLIDEITGAIKDYTIVIDTAYNMYEYSIKAIVTAIPSALNIPGLKDYIIEAEG